MDTDHRAHLSPLRRCGERMLDGPHSWGSVEVRPGRFGIVHHRFVVYPPGLSRAERRWVRLARGWPAWGGLAWLLCQIWLNGTMPHWAALGCATAVLLGTGAVTLALAGEARTRVRSLTVTTMVGYDDAAVQAAVDRLATLSAVLIDADDRLARGQITVVDHELIWWRVYERLQDSATPSDRAA
ncbi:DUF6611 family protein [Mycobacterium sp. NPDC003449]